MFSIGLYYNDLVQVVVCLISVTLAFVSIKGYRKRPEGRYLSLMLAFIFLSIVSSDTALLELFAGVGPSVVQIVEVYLNPMLEALMAVSFFTAVAWSHETRKQVALVSLVALVLMGLLASISYEASISGLQFAQTASTLPAGCARPTGGFLIIASSLGYNDSMMHGAPSVSWPVLDVPEGTNVDITVCNVYSLPVGFQVAHYFDDQVENLLPGKVLNVDFLANQTGIFTIYCSVFSPIHIFLQSGKLEVT
ncbi:MAG TPA: hypothetical protein VEJ36_01855 [Nitrososphaerales archaeon]|nr:hypothetical protein [Nitrososphaerales archaeon]